MKHLTVKTRKLAKVVAEPPWMRNGWFIVPKIHTLLQIPLLIEAYRMMIIYEFGPRTTAKKVVLQVMPQRGTSIPAHDVKWLQVLF